MALDTNIRGSVTGNGAEVDASNRLLVRLPDATTPANVGGVRDDVVGGGHEKVLGSLFAVLGWGKLLV